MKKFLVYFLFILIFSSLNSVYAVDIPQTGTIPNVVIGGNDCPIGEVVYGIQNNGKVKCIVANGSSINITGATNLTGLTDVDPALQYDLHFIFFGDGAGAFTSGTFSHSWLDDIGTHTHAEIDSHIEDVSNPHATTYDQVGAVGLDNNETITGEKIFSFFPVTPSSFPDTDYQVANKIYVDSVALGMQWKPAVLSRTVNDSITCNSSTLGDRYIVPLYSGGDWLGYDLNVTECNGTNWLFESPATGWAVIVLDVSQGWVYNGLTWALFSNPTAYTFNQGVKLVGFDVQADLLTNGGLNLSGNSIQISSVTWNKVNKTGSVLNDIGNVLTTPSDGQCLIYNGTSSQWNSGSCGNGTGGGNSTSVATSTMYFASASQTAQGWTNMPLATTEIFSHVYSRLRMDLTSVTYYRLFADQAVAGTNGAVLRLQYSNDSTTWLDCSGDNLPINATLGFKQTAWIAMPSLCKGGDYYLRLVGQGGDAVADPSFREIAVQFKSAVGSSVPNVSTFVGLADVNISGQTDGQAVVWNSVQGKWNVENWGIIGNTTNWTSVVTDTLFFASAPMTAQTWTNQPLAVTELFSITYARLKKDLTYSPYYRIYVDQGAVGYSTAVLRLQYSLDQSLWLDCSGDNLAIGAGLGIKETGWLAVPQDCRKDGYLRLVGEGGDAVSDPSFRIIAVQFKTLVGDSPVGNISLVGLGDVNITNPLDGQIIFWDGTQNRWVSRNIGLANGSNIITTDVDFVASASATTTSVPVWTNMPLATTEFLGTTTTRIKIDLSSATEYRILINPSVIGSANSVLRLQCSTDQVLWVNCNDTNTSLGNTLGLKVGAWLPYPTAYKGDVYLRLVGQGGDAVADPSFRLVKVQFHVIAGNNTGGGTPEQYFGTFNQTEEVYVYNSTPYLINFNETKLNQTIDARAINYSNNTIARIGNCPSNQFVVNTTTSGVQCQVLGIPTETDPYWTANQTNYFNKTDINSNYVPYTGAINMLNLGTYGISGSSNITTEKMIITQVGGAITSRTNSFVTQAGQLLDFTYQLPETLPMIVSQYLQSDINGKLSWKSITLPAETDPVYTAQNTTIVRAGNYTCAGKTFAEIVVINSSGVFLTCSTPAQQNPTGMLAPFYLTACPSGWIMANGTAGTPDLRERFVVGNGTTYIFNTTGGNINHTHAYTPAGTMASSVGSVVSNSLANTKLTFAGTPSVTSGANPPYYATIWCMKT